jgi:DNA-binding NtrC family response regulator
MSAMSGFPMIAPPEGAALIASSNSALREQVLHRLNGRCRPVQQVLGGADALVKLEKGSWQVLFLDRRLPDLDAEELIAIIERRFPGTQVVLLDSDTALLPGDDEEAASNEGVQATSWEMRGEIGEPKPLPGMIGRSEPMMLLYRLARLVAPRLTTVLIAGPTGSGKELVARALHALSPRAARPFVVVNCAAIPESLLESELFGHTRGAFTGAVQPQLGRIPAAHGGTLFLDEVSELPLNMQAKLLRFLEQKEVQRLGTAEVTAVDVRVVAASNQDLAARASKGVFREDLFYRLAAFPLELPPLAERRSDIIPLAEHFLATLAPNGGRARLSVEAMQILEQHPWPGNVRELRHVVERASILSEWQGTVRAEHLYFPGQIVGRARSWPNREA